MTQYLDPKFIVETLGLVGTVSIIFAESGLFFGFFLPGDSLLFTAGLLSSQRLISLWPLMIFCFLAAVFGDNVGYWFGKRIGPKIFCKEDSFFWNKKHIDRSQKFFEKYGKKAIILARFMPVVRTFTPILAGVGKMDYGTFIRYNIIGGFIWTFGMILLGFYFGSLIPNPDKYLLPVIIIIILASLVPPVIEVLKAKSKK
ncbi:MAG TPA: DedA family protein [Candidatus Paceibacterota bacterium]|nr:DedA family protein [Candidatus Paceibacterota bacterium]